MEYFFEIIVYDLYFTVKVNNKKLMFILNRFCNIFKTYKFNYNYKYKKFERLDDKTYFAYNYKLDIYRFNINSLYILLKIFNYYSIKENKINIKIKKKKDNDGKSINIDISNKYTLRDYQNKCVDLVVNKTNPVILINLPTGVGKGLILTKIITVYKVVTAFYLLPRYLEKWKNDLLTYTNLKENDIAIVQGIDKINFLINSDIEELDYKIYLFSLNTIDSFIKNTITDDTIFNTTLELLLDKLKVGLIVSDECHQSFHMLFNSILYTKVKKFIGMSATMETNNKELNNIYNLFYTKDSIISDLIDVKRYINVYAVSFKLINAKNLFSNKHNTVYNHIIFEKKIIKYNTALTEYFTMLFKYINKYYIKEKSDNDKIIIFFSTKKICNLFLLFLSNKLSNLKIRTYLQEDTINNVIDGDVIISTHLSLGTAFDVENLLTVINTVPVFSVQANKQNIGRLRYRENKTMSYIYFYSPDINNHNKMHAIRLQQISHIAKEIIYEEYPNNIVI